VGRQELEICMGDEHISFTVHSTDTDGKDWVADGCAEECRPRGIEGLLLLGSGSQVSGVFADILAF
jgi:hypothetical protein